MPAVRLCGVSFRYEDPIEVLNNVNLHLPAAWTGVVGENGGGKSTLLGLIAQTLVATPARWSW